MEASRRSSERARSRPVTPRALHRQHRDSLHERRGNELVEQMSQLLIDQDRAHQQQLDRRAAEQQKRHTEALDRALSLHFAVCDSAKQALEFLHAEKERLRLEEQARQERALQAELKRKADAEADVARQRLAAENAANELRQQKAKQEHEENARRAETQRRENEERARQKAESDRKVQQEAEAKAKAKSEADAKAAQQQREVQPQAQSTPLAASTSNGTSAPESAALAPTTSSAAPAVAGLFSNPEERERIHQAYLDLHKRLKQMRKDIEDVLKKAGLKNKVGDIRRKIAAHFGQITKSDSKKNGEVVKRVYEQLDQGVQLGGPTIDVAQCFAEAQTASSGQAPSVIIYLLIHVAKLSVRQMMTEAGRDRGTANGIGVVILSIFSDPRYQYNGRSFIDFLWAKYHLRCPVLFGINGNASTPEGKRRLGWREDRVESQRPNGDPILDRNGDPITQKMFVDTKEHLEAQGGLAVGFAACTLRNFAKSSKINPVPNRMYWEAVARIVNLPTHERHVTHYEVLLSLMDPSMMERFILLYGEMALVVMRKAFVDFPQTAPPDVLKNHPGFISALTGRPAALDMILHLAL